MANNTLNTAAVGHLCDKLRRESGGLFVVAVRADDAAYSCDPRIAPKDFGKTLENEIPALVEHLAGQRRRARS